MAPAIAYPNIQRSKPVIILALESTDRTFDLGPAGDCLDT
jgi:hypothetical protein